MPKQAEIIYSHPNNPEYVDVSEKIKYLISNGWVVEDSATVSSMIVYILSKTDEKMALQQDIELSNQASNLTTDNNGK